VAFFFSFLGGILILAEGLAFLVLGSVAGAAGYAAAGSIIGALGAVESVLGLVVLVLAFAVVAQPVRHREVGLLILVFSVGSFLVGGGFYLGAALGTVGGVLAIVFQASYAVRVPSLLLSGAADRTCARCGRLYSGDGRTCPFCRAAA
jgi:hypothetical protein